MKKTQTAKKNKQAGIFRSPRVWGPLLILVLAGTVLWFIFLRPRPVWLVEGQYLRTWERLIAAGGPSSMRGARILPLDAPLGVGNHYGYRITSSLLEPGASPETETAGAETAGEVEIRVYRDLHRQNRYQGALTLALDPWMVFRKFTERPLTRDQVEDPLNARVNLLLPGGEENTTMAWTAQFLQESPASFPGDWELWERTAERLLAGRYFQSGARTYTWQDIWPLILGDEPFWLYAPLSKVRELPAYRTNVLEADIFPGPGAWIEFGLQADILWAVPFGNFLSRWGLDKTASWLQDAGTQTRIADTLGWLAAHRDAQPYNPVTGAARIAWLSSSFIWEKVRPRGDTL